MLVLLVLVVVGFWETDHFFEAPGQKNCSPAHLVTHERGLGEKESPGNDDAMGILHTQEK